MEEKYLNLKGKTILNINGNVVQWTDLQGQVIAAYHHDVPPMDATMATFRKEVCICILIHNTFLRIHNTVLGDAQDVHLEMPVRSLFYMHASSVLVMPQTIPSGNLLSMTYPSLRLKEFALRSDTIEQQETGVGTVLCYGDNYLCSLFAGCVKLWRLDRIEASLPDESYNNMSMASSNRSSSYDGGSERGGSKYSSKHRKHNRSSRASHSGQKPTKREDLLAIILGVAGKSDHRASIGAASGPAAESRHDFTLHLLCKSSVQAAAHEAQLVQASFAQDIDGNMLLHILANAILGVYRVVADQLSTTLELIREVAAVDSFAHVSLPLLDASFKVPVTLLRHQTSPNTLVLVGAQIVAAQMYLCGLDGLPQVAELRYDHCDATAPRLTSLTDNYIAHPDYVRVKGVSGVDQTLKILPLLFGRPSDAALAVALVEYLPAEVSSAALALIKLHESLQTNSTTAIMDILLSAFLEDDVRWHQALTLHCAASTLESFASLRRQFRAVLAQHAVAAEVFDVCHCLCSDYLLRGQESEAACQDAALALLSVASLWMRTSANNDALTLALDYCEYYNRLLGYSADAHQLLDSIDAKPRSDLASFSSTRHVPCAIALVETQFSCMFSQQPLPLDPAFAARVTCGHYSKTSFMFLRYTILFFQELVLHQRDARQNVTSASEACAALANTFNCFLQRIASKVNIALGSNDLLIQGTQLPVPLRTVIELALAETACSASPEWVNPLLRFVKRKDLLVNNGELVGRISAEAVVAASGGEEDLDGLGVVQQLSLQRFPDDLRVTEVCRMLRSSRPLYLRVPRGAEIDVNDPNAMRHKQQLKLLALCRRSLAVVIGRGMLSMGSLNPLVAELLPIPPLCLKGRTPPNDTLVTLDVSSAPSDLTLWPDFHNGVAAALRLFSVTKEPKSITRSWIMYNKSQVVGNDINQTVAHAGLLFGLGLQGHLQCLSLADICDYLAAAHDPTTVAILVGASVTKFGTADPQLSRTLCLHLPSLLAPSHWDIEISPVVQAAALIGLGLLHVRTANRLMTEFLIAELVRPPSFDSTDTREAASLAAGWALGMVLLGKGSSVNEEMRGVADLEIEDRLNQYICGGKRAPGSRLFQTMNAANGGNVKSKKILANDDVNVNVVAPGAIVALALMYMQSSNVSAASRLAVPTTVYELDAVRPDVLIFRALGWSLVMWSQVEAAIHNNGKHWIDEQVPAAVRQILFHTPKISVGGLDENSAFPVYLCVICGYCFGVGIIFAGTANAEAKDAIMDKLKLLQSIRDFTHPKFSNSQFRNCKGTVEMCLSVVALSLASVMAGTGDVDCLRVLREVRWKYEDGAFGFHLAIGMAIGLLFLAGGRASLRRDPVSIAALIISFCPRFPARTVDNQYHLQALRNMYVLAVEWRSLTTVDVESGSSAAVTVTLSGGEHLTTPCLLPELSSFVSIEVVDDRYCPSSVKVLADDKSTGLSRASRPVQKAVSAIAVKMKRKAKHQSLGGEVMQLSTVSFIERCFFFRCYQAANRNIYLSEVIGQSELKENLFIGISSKDVARAKKEQLHEIISCALSAYFSFNNDVEVSRDVKSKLSALLLKYGIGARHQMTKESLKKIADSLKSLVLTAHEFEIGSLIALLS